MNLLIALIIVKGSLTLDATPLTNQQILVIDSTFTEIIYGTTTDQSGNYTLEIPESYKGQKLQVVAKINSELIAIEHQEVLISKGSRVDFKLSKAQYIQLTGTVDQELGFPSTYSLLFSFEDIPGKPKELCSVASKNASNSIAPFYFQKTVQCSAFSLLVQKGTYKIAAFKEAPEKPIHLEFPKTSKKKARRMLQLHNSAFDTESILLKNTQEQLQKLGDNTFKLIVESNCELQLKPLAVSK